MKTKIWLVLLNVDTLKRFTKYFETEYEKDKFKRKIRYLNKLIVIEDSSDIYYGEGALN
jgi:hypothetical protein